MAINTFNDICDIDGVNLIKGSVEPLLFSSTFSIFDQPPNQWVTLESFMDCLVQFIELSYLLKFQSHWLGEWSKNRSKETEKYYIVSWKFIGFIGIALSLIKSSLRLNFFNKTIQLMLEVALLTKFPPHIFFMQASNMSGWFHR